MPPGRGGQELPLSLADQLALGRVLHRYLSDDHYVWMDDGPGDDAVPITLQVDGSTTIERDDELAAVRRVLGDRWPFNGDGENDRP